MTDAMSTARFAPDFDEQSFDTPWQATLFAITIRTSQAGHFSWTEWGERFSAGLARHGDTLTSEAYFQTWIDTFCELLGSKLAIDEANVRATMEDWRRSYLVTPHGQSVELRRDLPATIIDGCRPEHHHQHHHANPQVLPGPIYVDPVRPPAGGCP